MDVIDLEKLFKLGKEWKSGDKHRIYFDHLDEYLGLKLQFNAKRRIVSGELNGLAIHVSAAVRLHLKLKASKVWYDLKDGCFYCKDMDSQTFKQVCVSIMNKSLKDRLHVQIKS